MWTTSVWRWSFFFFSSRRRHTRCLSDWSSDVCSSDLLWIFADGHAEIHKWRESQTCVGVTQNSHGGYPAAPNSLDLKRSEERRVGKECRYRWLTGYLKNNNNTTSAP